MGTIEDDLREDYASNSPKTRWYIIIVQTVNGLKEYELEAYTAADALTQAELNATHHIPKPRIYKIKPK